MTVERMKTLAMYRQLRQDLGHQSMRVRKKALGTLALTGGGSDEAFALARAMLDDTNSNVRAAALKACLLIQPACARAILQKLLDDSHPIARKAAIEMAFGFNVSEVFETVYTMAVYDVDTDVKRTCFRQMLVHCREVVHTIASDLLSRQSLLETFPEDRPNYLDNNHPLRVRSNTLGLLFEITDEQGDEGLLDIIGQRLETLFSAGLKDGRGDDEMWRFLVPSFTALCNHRPGVAHTLAEQLQRLNPAAYDTVLHRVQGLKMHQLLNTEIENIQDASGIDTQDLHGIDSRDSTKAEAIIELLLQHGSRPKNYAFLSKVARYFADKGDRSRMSKLVDLLPYRLTRWDTNQKQFLRALVDFSLKIQTLSSNHFLHSSALLHSLPQQTGMNTEVSRCL